MRGGGGQSVASGIARSRMRMPASSAETTTLRVLLTPE